VVPRRPRQSDGRGDRRPRVRREVRRSQEARGRCRDRPLDARELSPQRWPHARPEPELLSCPACLTSIASSSPSTRTTPRACRRSSPGSTTWAGIPRHDQPHGLDPDQGHAEAGSPPAPDRGVLQQRGDAHLDAHDRPPFNDLRVRQAISLAIDRQGMIDATQEGVGIFNPAVPAALKEWSLPIAQLGEGARYFKHDPAEARRLLAAAGYPGGFPGSVCFTTYGSTVLTDNAQLILKYLKDVGIDAKAGPREYGSFISSCYYRQVRFHDVRPADAVRGARQLRLRHVLPGRAKNQSHVDDPVVTDFLIASGGSPTLSSAARCSTTSSAIFAASSTTCRSPPASTSPPGMAR